VEYENVILTSLQLKRHLPEMAAAEYLSYRQSCYKELGIWDRPTTAQSAPEASACSHV
jgi:hypothetical protein